VQSITGPVAQVSWRRSPTCEKLRGSSEAIPDVLGDTLQIALEHPTAHVVWSRGLGVFGDKATAFGPMTMYKQACW